MIKSEKDILFNRCKNAVGFYKSDRFKQWFKQEYPGYDPHHIFGSFTSIKTTDLCTIPLTRQQHEFAEKHKSEFAFNHLHILLQVLIKYIKHLEESSNEIQ
jgi:hypothetical protein